MCLLGAVGLAVLSTVAVGARQSAPGFAPWTPAPEPAPRAPDQAIFRLGDAAKPFGWSTVVGDFNTDGKADVAIADRIQSRTGEYSYRIEFSISGQARTDVTFESTRDALTLNLADVDRDNDLDVVVRTPLSGETVGVWLNDGRGHFTAGALRPLAAIQPLASLGTSDPAGEVATIERSPRRADDFLAAIAGAPAPRPTRRFVPHPSPRPQSTRRSLRQNTRAPPPPPSTSLS